ncbi:aminotransferase class I/II-fold pyridoxal phosphate-dependent enzyme [Escherichia coli]
MVYVCQPQQPDRATDQPAGFRTLLELTRGKAIVVADEAYIEFCPQASLAGWLAEYPHLAICRTLSKAFALAGLRCGFTLANGRSHQPADESDSTLPALDAGRRHCGPGVKPAGSVAMRERVAQIIAEREYLIAAVKKSPAWSRFLTLKPTTFWRALKPPVQCLNLCGIRAFYVIRINNPL